MLDDDLPADPPAVLPADQIRPAVRDDLVALEAFLGPFIEAKQVIGRTADELIYLLSTSFVAVDPDDTIVGFATLEIYSHKLAEVRSLTVAADRRGHGLGQRIVEACVDLARRKNIFEVMAITAAEPLFERCGFDAALPGQKKALFLQTREQ